MKRILITGASGLLGLNLALEASRRHAVFGAVNRRALPGAPFEVLQADLLAPGAVERLLERARPDWVIHCAALAVVDACEADPGLAAQLNSQLPGKLARLVARGGARLVHISTDAVFDGRGGNYGEEDEPNPVNVYGRTKLAGERAVAEANPQAAIVRVNLFGWSLSGERSLAEWFFNNLSAGRPVKGFTDVFFCPMLANDLARVLLKVLEKGLSGLYHAVGSQCVSKYHFGLALARQFGFDEDLISPASVEEAGLKASRSPRLTLRCEKLSQALGEALPEYSAGLSRFHALHQQGYPRRLAGMLA